MWTHHGYDKNKIILACAPARVCVLVFIIGSVNLLRVDSKKDHNILGVPKYLY